MQFTSDAITLWPSAEAFADDLGVTLATVRLWRHRRAIPHRHWSATEDAAIRRGIKGVTTRTLSDLTACYGKRKA